MRRVLIIAGLLVAAGACGCESAATRAWQSVPMPTHDRQMVFEAARAVFQEHFEIAEANFAHLTIVTKPQVFDRKRSGTLADIRGAGGRWRRTASFEMDRDGLAIIGRAAVRLEREATAAAEAIADTANPRAEDELPRTGLLYQKGRTQAAGEVWTEVGYDESLARELLATIAERVRKAEGANALPPGQSPREAADEARRLGAPQGL